MKQFQIFRYLKRWRYLIAAFMIIGGLLFYYYASTSQSYTAKVRIRYTSSSAAQGTQPDGSPLDVSEILSSRVINGVLKDLNSYSSIEGVRSRCSISEVIPDDELIRKAAILDLGEEYVYYPTDYDVQFVAGADSSAEFARRVVSSVLDNYFRYYAEKYISDAVLPDNASNLSGSNYDFIEQIDLIEQSISDIMSFLETRSEDYSSFRSAQTGYSFEDLYNIYAYIYDNTLPYLYSQVIDRALTLDANVLNTKYEESIQQFAQRYQNTQEQLTYLDSVIRDYAAKLHESTSAQAQSADATKESGRAVLQSVYDWDRTTVADRTTTYDKLIEQRIDYQLSLNRIAISRQHDTDMQSAFSGAATTVDSAASQRLFGEISKLIEELSGIHETLTKTYEEFNDYRAAQNISVISNVNVSLGLNIQLYLALTVAVFFVFGCIGAIVLGRGEDILQYVIYNDKKTGLPNRARCDVEIAKYENAILPDNFCCVVVSLNNLRVMNDSQGYAAGNTMLWQLGLILKEVTNGLGFVGYNNSGQYICLFSDCTAERADSMRARLLEMVGQYNADESVKVKMVVSAAYSCTTLEKVYDIKQLMRLSYQKLREQN